MLQFLSVRRYFRSKTYVNLYISSWSRTHVKWTFNWGCVWTL